MYIIHLILFLDRYVCCDPVLDIWSVGHGPAHPHRGEQLCPVLQQQQAETETDTEEERKGCTLFSITKSYPKIVQQKNNYPFFWGGGEMSHSQRK